MSEDTNLSVIDGEKEWTLRKLNSGDARKAAKMFARISGDDRITQALATGERTVIIAAVIAVFMDLATDELTLFLARLTGDMKRFDFDKEWENARKEAREDGYIPNEAFVQRRHEKKIIEHMDEAYPLNFIPEAIAELMERPDFEDFLRSVHRLSGSGTKLSTSFQKLFNANSDSPTEK